MPRNKVDHLRSELERIGVNLDTYIISSIPKSEILEDGTEVPGPSEATVTLGFFLPSHFAPDAGELAEGILDLTLAVLKNHQLKNV